MTDLPSDWPARLPAEFYVALQEFNRREYFACHETLEALWIPEKGSIRQIYQGILQIAVGCYHLTHRGNWVGAVNKLEAGARRLERLGVAETVGDMAYEVEWKALVTTSDRLQAHLRTLGRDEVQRYDRELLPTVVFHQKS